MKNPARSFERFSDAVASWFLGRQISGAVGTAEDRAGESDRWDKARGR